MQNVRKVRPVGQGPGDTGPGDTGAVPTGDPSPNPDGFRPVKSAYRTLEVLETLAAGPRFFAELAQGLGIPKSSLHGIVATMENRGWVEQAPGGRVRLGLHALQVGTAYLEADEAVARTAALLDRLAAITGETVQLARLDGSSVVYLAKRDSTHPVRLISAVGARLPAHATALGKALLAVRDLEEVRRSLTFPLESLTSHTLTDWGRLGADLELTRNQGYAVDREEAAEGLRCFAITPAGTVPALDAISVSVPAFRLSRARERALIAALCEIRETWSAGRSQPRA